MGKRKRKEERKRKDEGIGKGWEERHLLYGSLAKAPRLVKGGARQGRRAYPAGSARPPCNTGKTGTRQVFKKCNSQINASRRLNIKRVQAFTIINGCVYAINTTYVTRLKSVPVTNLVFNLHV